MFCRTLLRSEQPYAERDEARAEPGFAFDHVAPGASPFAGGFEKRERPPLGVADGLSAHALVR
jgi:hypothetical protein